MPTINLLPDDYHQRRQRRRANGMCLVLFAVVMAGVVGAVFVSERRVARAEAVAEQVESEYQQATGRIAEMQRLEAESERLQKKAEDTAALVERLPRSTLLAVITNWLPEHSSLREVVLEAKKVRVPSGKSKGKKKSKYDRVASERVAGLEPEIITVRITGLARTDVDVGQLLAHLNRSPLFVSARFIYSEETEVEGVVLREFQLEAVLNQSIDAIDVIGPQLDAAEPFGRDAPEGGPA